MSEANNEMLLSNVFDPSEFRSQPTLCNDVITWDLVMSGVKAAGSVSLGSSGE
jgi:hypothetical protein